ncbi:hypothetical protein ACS0TY_012175 [Phlomoides rotata]
MLTHSGIITNCSLWSTPPRRPMFFPIFRCFFTSPDDFASTSSSKASQVDDDYKDFFAWLEKKAGEKFSTALSIGNSDCGRTLYASKDIEKMECLLQVPFNVLLSSENLRPEFRVLIEKEVSDVGRVAVVILHEKKKGQDSEWEPYLSRLPRPEDMHSSVFWSDQELETIELSCLYQQTLNQKDTIDREFRGVKSVFEKFPDQFEDTTLEEFTYAYQLVKSRAWPCQTGVSMIPFADFLNHDYVSDDQDNWNEEHFQVLAGCDYKEGEEVRILYGKYSNAALLLNYGFTLSKNSWDICQITLNIPPGDALYTQKYNILHSPNLKKEKGEFSNLSWNTFELRKVESEDLAGKGIPPSLRAFARVVVCDSDKELKGWSEDAKMDGGLVGRLTMNRGKERAAHQFLRNEISQLIEKHNKHLMELITTPPGEKSVAARKKSAQQLLESELRIMQSAFDWLGKHYSNSN